MNAQWLLSWWNLIFIVPFALALLYLGVYTLSGWTFGETDIDAEADLHADIDADADVDVHADVDADVDADMDADGDFQIDHGLHMDHEVGAETETDADADHDADTDQDADSESDSGSGVSLIWGAMSFLGVGTVPVSIVLMILLMSWGAVGFSANQFVRDWVGEPWEVATMSLPIAFLASVLITSGTSRLINRFMPLNVTTAKRRHELLGSTGEVILPIDATFGMASVRDPSGDLYQVPCRLEAGGTVPKGARVKLVAYNARESLFYVLPQ